MRVKVKRVDKSLPMPEYQTDGSVGFDLYSRLDMEIAPGELAHVPLNVIVETPEGHMFLLSARSSTFKRTGLIMPNSVGVIDCDYCGEEDEISIQLYNISKETAKIERGQRIAQGVIVSVQKIAQWDEVKKMGKSRGGFGSTGRKIKSS